MSTSPKKVEPILCMGPCQNEGPDLPTKFQILENLLCKDETCSARRRLALPREDLLYKERRQGLTTIKSPNILIKRYA